MTQKVKAGVLGLATPRRIENAWPLAYNFAVLTAGISRCLLLSLVVLGAAACGEKKSKDPAPITIASGSGTSGAGAPNTPAEPASDEPLPGVDLTKLGPDRVKVFNGLVNTLRSPCGKPESLRKSVTSDTSCKRAPFAVRYILALLEDEAPEEHIRKEYVAKYEATAPAVQIDVSAAPHLGPTDASIRIVEFFDYGCPHCREFREVLDAVLEHYDGKVAAYYMMFPLGHWPGSRAAAAAALAANKQGKFKELHALLLDKQPQHSDADLARYAKEVGLDVEKLQADAKALLPQVDRDKAQGEAAGVNSTPGIFFNNRKYTGPLHPKYFGLWIDEELAVNR